MLAQTTDGASPVSPHGTENLTIREAAIWLRETERSVHRRIAAGQLPAYRIGTKRIVVKRADVEALLVPVSAA